MRFGTSIERRTILNGWLRLRAALHEVGVTEGFQWLDGSFLEDIEMTVRRPPRDIDCVTYYHLPTGKTEEELLRGDLHLFLPAQTKIEFLVDAYFVNLEWPPEYLVDQSSYWYSVWSHRRDSMWKGFIQVSLDPADDETGSKLLSSQTWEDA